jgi:hypothetical protein
MLEDQAFYHLLANQEIGFALNSCPHGKAIFKSIALHARPLHRGAFARPKDLVLNAGPIGRAAHLAADGVNLLDQMTLSQPAYGRIARHQPHGVRVERIHPDGETHPGRGQSSLASGVSRADHDDVNMCLCHEIRVILSILEPFESV